VTPGSFSYSFPSAAAGPTLPLSASGSEGAFGASVRSWNLEALREGVSTEAWRDVEFIMSSERI